MAIKKFIEVQISTGRYLGSWIGPELDTIQPMEGRSLVIVDPETADPVAGSTWNGTAFVAPVPAAPRRLVRKGQFMDRFPLATQIALEAISEQQTSAGRMIRVFTRRLEAEDPVNLDSPTLVERLQQLAPVLIAAQVEGWEDVDAAAATIAGILA